MKLLGEKQTCDSIQHKSGRSEHDPVSEVGQPAVAASHKRISDEQTEVLKGFDDMRAPFSVNTRKSLP